MPFSQWTVLWKACCYFTLLSTTVKGTSESNWNHTLNSGIKLAIRETLVFLSHADVKSCSCVPHAECTLSQQPQCVTQEDDNKIRMISPGQSTVQTRAIWGLASGRGWTSPEVKLTFKVARLSTEERRETKWITTLNWKQNVTLDVVQNIWCSSSTL